MYETYMGWSVGEVGKQRVHNTTSVFPLTDPLINSPLSNGRICHRCAAFLVFEAVPNRPSYMDTGQCPGNVFSRAWALTGPVPTPYDNAMKARVLSRCCNGYSTLPLLFPDFIIERDRLGG
jgi:hypothetical protein